MTTSNNIRKQEKAFADLRDGWLNKEPSRWRIQTPTYNSHFILTHLDAGLRLDVHLLSWGHITSRLYVWGQEFDLPSNTRLFANALEHAIALQEIIQRKNKEVEA